MHDPRLPVEAIQFLSTTVLTPELDDVYYWRHSINGQYTINSGYKMIYNNPFPSDGDTRNKIWYYIWKKFSVQPKIRMFTW